MHPSREYDAVIVGGGPAGLSAALVLGRARRRVLVIDDGRPANAVSQGVGGLLGHERRRSGGPACDRAAAVGRAPDGRGPPRRRRGRRAAAATGSWSIRAPWRRARSRGRLGPRAALRPAAAARDRRRCGGGRCSIARSATAGRCATGPWRCTAAAPAAVRSALVLASWSNDVVLCTDGAPDAGGARRSASAGVRVRRSRSPGSPEATGASSGSSSRTGPAERARSAVREHAPRPAERARRRARLRADRGRDDRHRRRRADERRRRVRRRRRGDRALAVGGQRDRHRIARRVRSRARPRPGTRGLATHRISRPDGQPQGVPPATLFSLHTGRIRASAQSVKSVETAGIEPASAIVHEVASTSVSGALISSRGRLAGGVPRDQPPEDFPGLAEADRPG